MIAHSASRSLLDTSRDSRRCTTQVLELVIARAWIHPAIPGGVPHDGTGTFDQNTWIHPAIPGGVPLGCHGFTFRSWPGYIPRFPAVYHHRGELGVCADSWIHPAIPGGVPPVCNLTITSTLLWIHPAIPGGVPPVAIAQPSPTSLDTSRDSRRCTTEVRRQRLPDLDTSRDSRRCTTVGITHSATYVLDTSRDSRRCTTGRTPARRRRTTWIHPAIPGGVPHRGPRLRFPLPGYIPRFPAVYHELQVVEAKQYTWIHPAIPGGVPRDPDGASRVWHLDTSRDSRRCTNHGHTYHRPLAPLLGTSSAVLTAYARRCLFQAVAHGCRFILRCEKCGLAARLAGGNWRPPTNSQTMPSCKSATRSRSRSCRPGWPRRAESRIR